MTTDMTLKNPTNRNALNTTATLWTLSGIALAACGGGGGGGSNVVSGRGVFPTGLASIGEDDVILPVSGGMIMDLMLPRHVARSNQPYVFMDDLSVTGATIAMRNTAFRADGSREVMAFGVDVVNDVPMLDAGEWVYVVSMSANNRPAITTPWEGDYNAEGPRGADFADGTFGDDKMMVKELYIKLTPGHGLPDTNWQSMLAESHVHKIYFEADVFRNGGEAYQGNIRATVLVNPQEGDSGARGDVDLYLKADTNGDGMNNSDDVTQQYRLSVNGFNTDTFRAIDNTDLNSQNKNLLGYMVGGDLGNNYLRWIGQSVDGGGGPVGALAIANSDTIYADFYINIPDGWNVRLIWWLDDVLEAGYNNRPITGNRDNLPGFDGTLDFDYAGLIADPAATNLTTMAHVSDNPMINGVDMNNGNYVPNNDGYISGFSNIGHFSNQFSPTIAGRYYVQVMAYDPDPARNGVDTIDANETAMQAATAYFGFDNLHEVDVQPADFREDLFEAFYGSGSSAPEIT